VELRHKQVPISKVEYLKLLSGPLNVELQTALYKPRLMLHPFFITYNDSGRSAMKRLCSVALHSEHFAKSDTVFQRDDQAKHMHCVTQGCLVYCVYRSNTDRHKRLVRLIIDEYCSEAALWIPWRHRGHMKGLTDCELMMINADKFMDVTISSKEDVHELARTTAIHFASKMQAYTSFGRVHVHDITQERMAIAMSEELGSKAHKKDEIHRAEELEMQLIDFSDSECEQEQDGAKPERSPSKGRISLKKSNTRLRLWHSSKGKGD